MIEDRLRDLGFTSFAFALDEEEAVAAASERCPDLITSDVQLGRGCRDRCGPAHLRPETDPGPLHQRERRVTVQERCPAAVVIQKPFGTADLCAGISAGTKGRLNWPMLLSSVADLDCVDEAQRLQLAALLVANVDPVRAFDIAVLDLLADQLAGAGQSA